MYKEEFWLETNNLGCTIIRYSRVIDKTWLLVKELNSILKKLGMVLLLGCVTLKLTSCHEKLYSSFDKINFIQIFCKVLLFADL